ncbi:MAG: type II toxin-antitoxin system VapC family toxin [Verrucomicrobiota bacterium]
MKLLIDTNIVSELRNPRKTDPAVAAWAEANRRLPQYISVISVREIRKGIESLRRRSPEQCASLEQWLAKLLATRRDFILPISEPIADAWGRIQSARTRPIADSLIAATAIYHDLTLATRNVRDFESLPLRVVNPFTFETEQGSETTP